MTLLTLTPALLNSGIPQVQNIIDQLPNHPTKKYLQRDITKINTLVVHHMASEAPLINQAKYHVNGRLWPRIGYHFVIHNGAIYQTNYLDTESYHTTGQNRTGIGVAILGDLTKRSITQRERELLAAVLTALRGLYPDAVINGHNAYAKTACPATDMNVIREDVSALELKMELEANPNQQVVKAFDVNTRITQLYKIATNPGPNQIEALRKMGIVYDTMKQTGLL